ncbi:MAG: transketolase [Lachnospiraceae bacterium]|nr:transketolase [Lachnospiraceae bacterium]
MDEKILCCQKLANNMRREMIDLVEYANDTMHWGGAYSSAEILAVLYQEILNCKEKNILPEQKDKFLLSKGHAALAVYTVLHQMGMLSDEQIKTYQKDGSCISELMTAKKELGFETSGGSLGINLSYAVGLALLAKRKGYTYKTYVEVGDGELDEGAIWEAVMSASQFGLDNLTMIVDANTIQSDGPTKDIMSWENLEGRLESFGWKVVSVDGHNCKELLDAFLNHGEEQKPKAVIANTVKGKGVSFFENDYLWHDKVLRGAELEQAKKEVISIVENGF